MERHQSQAALRHFFESPHAAGEATVAHLICCRACWHKATLVLDSLQAEGRFTPSPLAAAVARLMEGESSHVHQWLLSRGAASQMKQLPPSEQRKRARDVVSLQTDVFVGALLEETAALWRSDPHAAEHLARLADEVAAALPGRRYSAASRSDLRSEAHVYLANSRRLAADFAGAHSALTEARELLKKGTGDPHREALWLSSSAALAADLGQFEPALPMLARADHIYRQEGDADGIALTAVQKGGILLAALREEEALARAQAALLLPNLSPRLEMLARSIAVEALIGLGRAKEASLQFAETHRLYAQFPDCAPRALYLEARLLDSLGDVRGAERRFKEAARSFLDIESYKEALLTFLSLFEAYFKRQAYGKAVSLCQEVLGIAEMLVDRPAIERAWEELLVLAQGRTLGEGQLQALRQYCTAIGLLRRRSFRSPASRHRFNPQESLRRSRWLRTRQHPSSRREMRFWETPTMKHWKRAKGSSSRRPSRSVTAASAAPRAPSGCRGIPSGKRRSATTSSRRIDAGKQGVVCQGADSQKSPQKPKARSSVRILREKTVEYGKKPLSTRKTNFKREKSIETEKKP